MKKGVGAVAILLVIAVALYLFFNPKKPEPPTRDSTASQTENPANNPVVPSTNTSSASTKSTPSQTETPPGSLAARAGEAVPDTSPATNLPPETVLQNVRRAIHQYGEMFGGNPVGTNPEITSQLSGNNPKHINFINAQTGARISADGELVDEWGTPYFFHQLSGSDTEIHSAGPDKIMWTSDDLVVK